MTSAATPTEHPCQSGGDCSCGGACGGPQTALQKAMTAEQARWARGTWFANGAGGVASSAVALANTHSTLANKAYEQIVAQSAKFAHDPAAHRKQHADFAAQFGVRFADAAMQKPAGGCAGCAGKNRSGGTGLTKAGAVNQAAVALGATAMASATAMNPNKFPMTVAPGALALAGAGMQVGSPGTKLTTELVAAGLAADAARWSSGLTSAVHGSTVHAHVGTPGGSREPQPHCPVPVPPAYSCAGLAGWQLQQDAYAAAYENFLWCSRYSKFEDPFAARALAKAVGQDVAKAQAEQGQPICIPKFSQLQFPCQDCNGAAWTGGLPCCTTIEGDGGGMPGCPPHYAPDGAGNCICQWNCGKGQTYTANCDGCECIPIQCSPGQSQDPKGCDCVPGCTGPSASKLCGGNISCDVGQVCIKRCCDGSNSLAQFVCSSPADAVHTSDGICSKF